MKATLLDHMGTDNTVVNAARVSFDKKAEDYTSEQNAKLIKYLAKHEHYSPFGHCFAGFHVKAPIFVRAQLVKNEYLRMNEISRRYVETTPEFFLPKMWRGRPENKKQGSHGYIQDSGAYNFALVDHYEEAIKHYEWLLEEGVAPEMARMLLPQSMYTEWYWSGSLDAFANMVKLRTKPDAQEETRVIAEQISQQMKDKFPISWSALV
jgi:thymidylate synthase (FAD)